MVEWFVMLFSSWNDILISNVPLLTRLNLSMKLKAFWDSLPDQPCSPRLYVQEQYTFCSQFFIGKEGELSTDKIQWNTCPSGTLLWCPLNTSDLHISSLSKPRTTHLSALKKTILKINWSSIFISLQNDFQMIGHSEKNQLLKRHYFL